MRDPHEISFKVLARRRILEGAHEAYDVADYDETIRHMLQFLENVQATDESIIDLHRECLAMTELCRKAIESEGLRAPIIITSPPIGTGEP